MEAGESPSAPSTGSSANIQVIGLHQAMLLGGVLRLTIPAGSSGWEWRLSGREVRFLPPDFFSSGPLCAAPLDSDCCPAQGLGLLPVR